MLPAYCSYAVRQEIEVEHKGSKQSLKQEHYCTGTEKWCESGNTTNIKSNEVGWNKVSLYTHYSQAVLIPFVSAPNQSYYSVSVSTNN